jgi:hypothetical protein
MHKRKSKRRRRYGKIPEEHLEITHIKRNDKEEHRGCRK